MSKETDYIDSLTDTVERLFDTGNTDPSAEEIAKAHWGFGRGIMSPDMVTGVTRRLYQIRQELLQREDQHQAIPISQKYYSKHRGAAELDDREARECLATGRGKFQTGLLKITEEPVRVQLFNLWNGLQVRQGVGRIVVRAKATELALGAGHIGELEARNTWEPLASLEVPAFARPAANGGGKPQTAVE